MALDVSKLGYRPCVGIMVINGEGLIWIGRRPDVPNEPEGPGSWWQMPQGGIDENEDPAVAAMRELAEETGIRSADIIAQSADWHYYDLPPELVGKAWGGRYKGQKQKWFLVRFSGPDSEVDISPAGHQIEFDTWRWAPLDEVRQCVVPFKRAVYDKVLDEFAPLVTLIDPSAT